jgi:hypothetical protein
MTRALMKLGRKDSMVANVDFGLLWDEVLSCWEQEIDLGRSLTYLKANCLHSLLTAFSRIKAPHA